MHFDCINAGSNPAPEANLIIYERVFNMNIDDLYFKYALNEAIDYKNLDEDIIKTLLNNIMNDKNSSMARESAILSCAKYIPLKSKLNYDGIKDNDFAEVKLRNYDTSRNLQSKLNGEGSYSDYTWDRYKKHLNDNPTLLIGGFINGILIYIFKVKYNSEGLQNRFKEKLTLFFGDINSKRKPNTYLRSLGFNYNHYANDAELIYIAPIDILCNNEKYISQKLYQRLINESK